MSEIEHVGWITVPALFDRYFIKSTHYPFLRMPPVTGQHSLHGPHPDPSFRTRMSPSAVASTASGGASNERCRSLAAGTCRDDDAKSAFASRSHHPQARDKFSSDIAQIWSSSRYPTLEFPFYRVGSHSKTFLERNRRYVIYLE
jgi:hypothetical protein